MSAQVTYVDWLENYAENLYKMTTILLICESVLDAFRSAQEKKITKK